MMKQYFDIGDSKFEIIKKAEIFFEEHFGFPLWDRGSFGN